MKVNFPKIAFIIAYLLMVVSLILKKTSVISADADFIISMCLLGLVLLILAISYIVSRIKQNR